MTAMPACRGRRFTGRPLWALNEEVDVLPSPDDEPIRVHGPWGTVEVHDTAPPLLDVLHRMTLGPVALENVVELQGDYRRWRAGCDDLPVWAELKNRLDRLGGYVVPSLGADDGAAPILSLLAEHLGASFDIPVEVPSCVSPCGGATLRERNGGLELARPGGRYRAALLREPAPAVVAALMDGPAAIDDTAAATGVAVETVVDIVMYLVGGDLLEPWGGGRCE